MELVHYLNLRTAYTRARAVNPSKCIKVATYASLKALSKTDSNTFRIEYAKCNLFRKTNRSELVRQAVALAPKYRTLYGIPPLNDVHLQYAHMMIYDKIRPVAEMTVEAVQYAVGGLNETTAESALSKIINNLEKEREYFLFKLPTESLEWVKNVINSAITTTIKEEGRDRAEATKQQ